MAITLQYLRYLYRKYGPLVFAACALFLASIIGYFALVRTSEASYASLTKELAAKQFEVKHQPSFTTPLPLNADASFYDALPQYSDLEKLLSILFAAANAHDVWFDQVNYKLEMTAKSHFNRYHISMPVTGNYIKIRQFLNDAMTQIPSLALNQISFSSEGQTDASAKDNEVQANIELTLFTQVQQLQSPAMTKVQR